MYNGPIADHNFSLQVTPRAQDLFEIEKYHEKNKDADQVLPLLPEHLKGKDYLQLVSGYYKINFILGHF